MRKWLNLLNIKLSHKEIISYEKIGNDIKIREYKSNDCNAIIDLFYNTVNYINAKDYTEGN